MPVIETKGAASSQGFGEFSKTAVANWIEDCFSCFLYTGNGSTQTITNGIDLAGKGGLVWIKSRSGTYNNNHALVDTDRGYNQILKSNTTDASVSGGNTQVTQFNSNGFSLGDNSAVGFLTNGPTTNYVSWTFRKAPKFFDIVTYTGDGVAGRTVAHSLGSVPGFIIVKELGNASQWFCYHRSLGATEVIELNNVNASYTNAMWNNTTPTTTVFSLGSASFTNRNGGTYVAYLFAHNAGGFGLTGTDNVISCGSYLGNGVSTGVGQGFQVTLGWEPQFVMIKRATGGSGSWWIGDNMRGLFGNGANGQALQADTSAAEQTYGVATPNATGFTIDQSDSGVNASGSTYIYIAIRRGPMKTPTSGTSVFSPQATTLNTASNTVVSSGSAGPMDFVINQQRSGAGLGGGLAQSRLTGGNYLQTSSTAAEVSSTYTNWDRMTGTKPIPWSDGDPVGVWQFRRAPGTFDEVCYTGTGSATTVTHNLGVVPELMIVKRRSGIAEWSVYSTTLGNTKFLFLNATFASQTSPAWWNNTSPTASVFTVGTDVTVNTNGSTYVAYLWATNPGVTKVGTFTGNGSTQTINCGFTSGARFVLIKRVDATGDWYVYDTARGMTTLTDPYLLLNSTAAESATLGSVTTVSTGFALNASILAAINTNGASYIFLAIA